MDVTLLAKQAIYILFINCLDGMFETSSVYLFSSLRVLHAPHRGPVVVSYWPATITAAGLDTERISVPFSSKGVNHMAYLAYAATVVWCVLLFI